MSERLPPLNSLPFFEAAARLLSFTKAADELAVTQSAVSHQIKALEAFLGIQLFHRRNRRLLLTEHGQKYLPEIQDALAAVRHATRMLRAADQAGILTVSALPSFASLWLVPRLSRFQSGHPDIELRLSATERLVDFEREDIDASIRYGLGEYPGLTTTRLMGDELIVVASPELLSRGAAVIHPGDLQSHRLIRYIGAEHTWGAWFKVAGINNPAIRYGTVIDNDALMVVQAAISGQGVALARRVLCQLEIDQGRLVQLFETSIPDDWAYFLVYPERDAERPKIQAFREWLLQENAAAPQQR